MGKWDNKKDKTEGLQAKVESLEKENEQLRTENEQLQNANNEGGSAAYTISIKEKGKEVKEVECGEKYVITLVGEGTDTLKGKFEGAAFNITAPNHLMAKRDSADKTCTIRYVYKGKTLATKSVLIKKD